MKILNITKKEFNENHIEFYINIETIKSIVYSSKQRFFQVFYEDKCIEGHIFTFDVIHWERFINDNKRNFFCLYMYSENLSSEFWQLVKNHEDLNGAKQQEIQT